MATAASIWWNAVACILILMRSGSEASMIEGVLHEDVLLPCTVIYKNDFNDEQLVVIWQTSVHHEVLHSFYDRMDHPKDQHARFKGRTQLFLLEIPKGNLSLLLKNVNPSDAGNYSCHVDLSIHRSRYIIQQVELLIKEPNPSYGRNYALICLLLLLPIICIISLKMKKKKAEPEEEGLLEVCPDEASRIQSFKRNICQTVKTCCKAGPCGSEFDHCLIRELSIVDMTKLQTVGVRDIQEACVGTIRSSEMFTDKPRNLASKRMLILGEAGIGKRCFCEELLKSWASGERTLCYKCIIYVTFHELNCTDGKVSVKQLLESKCKDLSPVLTDLLNNDALLLIFDGLDEFEHDLKGPQESHPRDNITIDTPLDVNILVSEIIINNLLPKTDVLVTSGFNSWRKWKSYFTSAFVLKEFTDKDIQAYCAEYCEDNQTRSHSYQFIKEYNLSSLVSVPLLNRALCEIAREQNLKCYKDKLDTWSRMLASLLQCTLRNISPETQVVFQPCCIAAQDKVPKLPEKSKRILHQLAKVSYETLTYNLQEIKKEDLGDDAKQLLNPLCQFFLIEKNGGSIFEYRHSSIRDILASLYCVVEIQDDNELKECLGAWAFGEIPSHPKTKSLLQNVPRKKSERFQNFIRYFLGFLAYGNMDDLLCDPTPLQSTRKDLLCRWFQDWIKRDLDRTDLLNIFHCIFELHDTDVTRALSSCFKTVSLCNTQLYSLDLTAMQYSLREANPEKLDLRMCELHDRGLKLLLMIKKCKNVWISSNQLTELSSEQLGNILADEACIIQSLSLASNELGPAGARRLWEAIEKNTCLRVLCLNNNMISEDGTEGMIRSLKKNKTLNELQLGRNALGPDGAKNVWKALEANNSLRVIYLNDNDITDEGTAGMVESLRKNSELKELHLCGNTFGEVGIRNIRLLKRKRPDLKVIVRIAEDDDLLRYMREKIRSLKDRGWQTDDPERTLYLLQSVLRDLSQVENPGNTLVETLKQDIKMARNSILQQKKTE